MPVITQIHDSESTALHPALHYRIGVVDVALDSDLKSVVRDFDRLYSAWRVDADDSSTPIEMTVHGRFHGRLRLPRYQVYGDGEAIGEPLPASGVFPFVEWGINFRVAFRRCEFLQIHAAALSRGGQGVIFAGDSGSGKSTLAAGLIRRGWRYYCDEFALIHPESLSLHPFPKALCVKAAAFDTIRSLGISLSDRRYYVKAAKGQVTYVNPLELNVGAVSRPCPVRWVILPRYVPGAKPQLLTISRAQAAYELARNAMNRSAHGDRALELLTTLAQDAECLSLRVGALDTTCDLLEDVVADS